MKALISVTPGPIKKNLLVLESSFTEEGYVITLRELSRAQ